MLSVLQAQAPCLDRADLKAKRVIEGPDSASIYLSRVDGGGLPPFSPGQWVDVTVPGGSTRSYVLSMFSSRPANYRITVLRQPGAALVSRHLLDALASGDRLTVSGPLGEGLIEDETRPLVVASRGIGVVAVVAMIEALLQAGSRRPLHVLLAERAGADLLLRAKIASLRAEMRHARFDIVVDAPHTDDRPGRDHDGESDLHPLVLAERLPGGDNDYVICGAAAFVEPLATILRAHGVAGERLKTLSFGELAAEHQRVERRSAKDLEHLAPTPRTIVFRRSGRRATWRPQDGTLLDLALAQGLELPFACRTGMCGTCAQVLHAGQVGDVRATSARPGPGKILLCSTVPASDVAIDV